MADEKQLLGDVLFGKSQLTPDPQLRAFFNHDYFNKPTRQAPMAQAPTPAPTPAPGPTPGPERQAPYRPTGFNVMNAPHLTFGASTASIEPHADAMAKAYEQAHSAYQVLKDFHDTVGTSLMRTLKEANYPPQRALEIMQRHAAAAPSYLGVIGPHMLRTYAQSLMKGMGLAGSGNFLFNIVGDPFNNNIRELGPPPGVSPFDTTRTYWNEKAL